jgi:hypothetical protein
MESGQCCCKSYRDGLVSEERLADGEVYKYSYAFDKDGKISKTTVGFPDGSRKTFIFQQGRYVDGK